MLNSLKDIPVSNSTHILSHYLLESNDVSKILTCYSFFSNYGYLDLQKIAPIPKFRPKFNLLFNSNNISFSSFSLKQKDTFIFQYWGSYINPKVSFLIKENSSIFLTLHIDSQFICNLNYSSLWQHLMSLYFSMDVSYLERTTSFSAQG